MLVVEAWKGSSKIILRHCRGINCVGHKATGQGKVDAQKKLIDKLEEVAKSLFDPARQQYAAKLEEMKKVLTAEQVQTIT